eukprot:6860923-Prymnesium_polylepis.1
MGHVSSLREQWRHAQAWPQGSRTTCGGRFLHTTHRRTGSIAGAPSSSRDLRLPSRRVSLLVSLRTRSLRRAGLEVCCESRREACHVRLTARVAVAADDPSEQDQQQQSPT